MSQKPWQGQNKKNKPKAGLSGDLQAFPVTYRPFRRLTGLSGDLSAFPATYRPFCRRSLLLPAACDILILFPNLLSAREMSD